MIELLADDVNLGDTVEVRARIDGVPEGDVPTVALTAVLAGTEADVPIAPDTGSEYVATWTPDEAGRWTLRLVVSGVASGTGYGAVIVRPAPV